MLNPGTTKISLKNLNLRIANPKEVTIDPHKEPALKTLSSRAALTIVESEKQPRDKVVHRAGQNQTLQQPNLRILGFLNPKTPKP